MKLPVPVYGEVPPVAVTVTVVDPPKQAILVAEELAETAEEGCDTVLLVVAVHPFASVTLNSYCPANKLLIDAVLSPVDHKIVYGVVPPTIFKEAEPLFPPLHDTLVWLFVTTIKSGCVIVTVDEFD